MITPLEDRVVLKQENDRKTDGGLFVPGIVNSNQASVVAVGEGRYIANGDLIKPDLKVGDKVIFISGAETEIDYEGEKLLIIDARNIMAKL